MSVTGIASCKIVCVSVRHFADTVHYIQIDRAA